MTPVASYLPCTVIFFEVPTVGLIQQIFIERQQHFGPVLGAKYATMNRHYP